jgi:hypothetical protein
MATAFSTIETVVRRDLKEASAGFWSQAELLQHMVDGVKNLWGAIIDLNEEHFLTVDESLVSLAANSTSLTGVPADCFKVHLIEPRDTTSSGTAPHTLFIPKDYNHPDFINARAMTAQDPGAGLKVYYHVTGQGAPVAAPTIRVAPKLSTALNLRFSYVQTLATSDLEIGDNNPIPGESDKAIHAYCMAFALAKEQEDKMPHPGWLSIYKTEKDALLVRLSPRQVQEERVVDDMWAPYNDEGSYL